MYLKYNIYLLLTIISSMHLNVLFAETMTSNENNALESKEERVKEENYYISLDTQKVFFKQNDERINSDIKGLTFGKSLNNNYKIKGSYYDDAFNDEPREYNLDIEHVIYFGLEYEDEINNNISYNFNYGIENAKLNSNLKQFNNIGVSVGVGLKYEYIKNNKIFFSYNKHQSVDETSYDRLVAGIEYTF